MNDETSHADILDHVAEVHDRVGANSDRLDALTGAFEDFVAQYERDRTEDQPLRDFIAGMHTVGRIGRYLRAAIGWLVVFVGGAILIIEYVIGKINA